jgi:hypothetical protein
MTRDQKTLILFQLDNLIELGQDLKPERMTALLGKLRTYVDELHTGKKIPKLDA